MSVNTNGVLYTAQAAGQQMLRFGNAGSIIMIASMSGSITNKVTRSNFSRRLFTKQTVYIIGPRMGFIQHKQVSSPSNGA